jgi:GntR family transcriptional regulator, transcriptional repressor for pyruvate dehydrogenase complex
MTVAPLDSAEPSTTVRRRPRNLALAVVDAFSQRIQSGALAAGAKLPPEAAIVEEFGVSRTVVREALSMLQASRLVVTRHGIGTFAIGPVDELASFRVTTDQMATLRDVISVLELRIAVESEAASLAATRREAGNLLRMRQALDAISTSMAAGSIAVEADFEFHLEVARATQNPHFENLMLALGQQTIIPRARLSADAPEVGSAEWNYLRQVQAEHESLFNAIEAQDPETARATMRTHLVSSRERRRQSVDNLAASQAGAGSRSFS